MVPNFISFFRLVSVVPLCYCIFENKFEVAAIIFFFAGFSDFFDGYFARKLGQESQFGAMLDPIADKVLIVTLIIVLGVRGIIPGWFSSLVMLRDVLILLGGFSLLKVKEIKDLPPMMISKLNTVFIMFLIMDIFLGMLFHGEFFVRFKENFVFLISVTTVLSFAVYFKRFIELCKR